MTTPPPPIHPIDPIVGLDPNDLAALQRRVAELQAQGNAVSVGGAVFQASVHAARDVIGGNLYKVIVQAAPAGMATSDARELVAHYLRAQVLPLATLKLGEIDPGLDTAQHSALQLRDVYVPLNTSHRLPQGATLARPQARAAGKRSRKSADPGEPGQFDPRHGDKYRPVSALEALAQHRSLTLLGVAGSGKSSFGSHVLLALAQAWLGQADDSAAALGKAWPHGKLLPLRIELRRLAQAHAGHDRGLRAKDLWDHLGAELANAGITPDAAQAVALLQGIALSHGVLWLLDGLDECGPPERYGRVLAGVHDLIANAPAKSRFLLTARPYAWPGGANPAQGVYLLDPLDDDQVAQFITAWYAARAQRGWGKGSADAASRDDLLRHWHRPDLAAMARNPLLLTQMTILHSNLGRLPDDRADLYNTVVDLLLRRWTSRVAGEQSLQEALNQADFRLDNLRATIARLAFEVHLAQSLARPKPGAGPDRQEAAADIGEFRLLSALRPLLGGSLDKAQTVVEFIEQRAGLLIGQGAPAQGAQAERQFSLPHRGFQEFLAAQHLAQLPDFEAQCLHLARAAPLAWGQVLPLAARLAGPGRAASAASELIGARSAEEAANAGPVTPADWHCALLAGLQLQEVGRAALTGAGHGPQRTAAWVKSWLLAALPVHPRDGGLTAHLRARAGDALAALGDPRFDPDRLHLPCAADLGFAAVPAQADYALGTRKADRARMAEVIGDGLRDDELNEHPVGVPAFQIARWPVTVAQFRAFVADSGHALGDADALRDPDNRPVRRVSWHDAQAYCQWLDAQLRQSSRFDNLPAAEGVRRPGWQVALPSEQEWECAARAGQPGAIFPWGDTPDPEAANCHDTGIGNTSAVGCFAPNPWGLHDMVGNVWQWTRSVWRPSYADPDLTNDPSNPGANAARLVRGGSWIDPRDDARCAYRGRFLPVFRGVDLGFRVVLRSSPV